MKELFQFVYFLVFISAYTNSVAQNFERHVCILASDSLGGRQAASVFEKKANEYIRNELQRNNIKSECQSFTYLGIIANNVIAQIKSNKKDSTIIFMAHYDGLGTNSSKSFEILASQKNKIHNGADDNASGVALLLELAFYLKNKEKLKYNFIFLFATAHEEGLYGSKYFFQHFKPKSRIKSFINLDMVGRLGNSNTLSVQDNVPDLAFYNRNSTLNFQLNQIDYFNHSDLKYAIPLRKHIIHITTGMHEDYHKHSDDCEKINYDGMKTIFNFLKNCIE